MWRPIPTRRQASTVPSPEPINGQAEFTREGKQQLPWGAYLARGDVAPPPPLKPPTLEEVRTYFPGEEPFTDFCEGTDYSYGFADLTDVEYEARFAALEEALRELVTSGQMEGGFVVTLDSIPHPALTEVPLLDGEWIDRRVLILAEWGAALTKQRFRIGDPGEDHPWVPNRIYDPKGDECESDDPRLGGALAKVEAKFATFPGRSKDIDGRLYLSFSDYLSWKKRALKGDLRAGVREGFVRESFNAWSRAKETASLAGVAVEPIAGELDSCRVEALPLEEALTRLKEWRRLQYNRGRFLTSCSSTDPRTTEATRDTEEFVSQARAWAEAAETLARDHAVLFETERTLSRRYLAGEGLFWPELKADLETNMTFLTKVTSLFHQMIEFEVAEAGSHRLGEAAAVALLELTPEPAEVKMLVGRLARKLAVQAKAETLQQMDDFDGASELVRPLLLPEETD